MIERRVGVGEMRYKFVIFFFLCIFMSKSELAMAQLQAFDVNASQAILLEANTGQVLFEKNIHDRVEPASLVKLMSMILYMEALERGEASLDDLVVASQAAAAKGGSQIWLEPGETMSVETLLKTITVVSANDSTVALAEYIAGTEDNFVRLMNNRAQEFELENTNFLNSTGLPTDRGEQYISAYDAAFLARELLQYPLIIELSSIWVDYIRDGRSMLKNTNDLINRYPGADGIKTGWTSTSGFHLVGTVEREGFRLIAGVLGSETNQERVEEVSRLLDYGFRAFQNEILARQGEVVAVVSLPRGVQQEVDVLAKEDLSVVIHRGMRDLITKEIVEKEVSAPIKRGDELAELVVYQEGEEMGRIPLLAAEDVNRASLWTRFIRWIQGLITSLLQQER